MAGPALIERLVGTHTSPAASSLPTDSSRLEIPRDFPIWSLRHRLSGTITISGGTTNGTIISESPMALVRRVLIDLSGGERPALAKNLPAWVPFRKNHIYAGVEPERATLAAGGVQTATPVACVFDIDFALPGPLAPELAQATMLIPTLYSSVGEVLSWDTLANGIVSGGDRTTAHGTVPTVDVYAHQAVNVAVPRRPPLLYKESYFSDTTSSVIAERRFPFLLPTGNVYFDILLSVTDQTAGLVPQDDLLGLVQLLAGPVQIRKVKWLALRAKMRKSFNLQQASNPITGVTQGNSANPLIGYGLIPFQEQGRLEQLLNTQAYPVRGVTLDLLHETLIATARNIYLITGEILVPKGV